MANDILKYARRKRQSILDSPEKFVDTTSQVCPSTNGITAERQRGNDILRIPTPGLEDDFNWNEMRRNLKDMSFSNLVQITVRAVGGILIHGWGTNINGNKL
jgi:hypothetical protein